MYAITDKAASKIKGNNRLMGKLMAAFNRTQRSIENWLDSKDNRLTTPMAVQIIKGESGLSEDEIVEEITEDAKVN